MWILRICGENVDLVLTEIKDGFVSLDKLIEIFII